MSNTKFSEFFNGISGDLSAEEIMLSSLQGIIAAEISMKRQKLGMNQTQLAEHLCVSQGLVSKWERGDANFTLETLVKIATKLHIPMQSPFAPSDPPQYRTIDNIIQFNGDGKWRSITTNPQTYESIELEEM